MLYAVPEVEAKAWVNDIDQLPILPSDNIRNWLVKPYKLSVDLKKVISDFNVYLISQEFSTPFKDEVSFCKEGLTGAKNPLVRRIYLRDGLRHLTFARTIVPTKTYENNLDAIANLGTKPIGETLLYCHPNYQRSGFEFKHCGLDSELLIESGWQEQGIMEAFARRSVFWLNDDPLVITELFHPELPIYPID